MAGESLTFPDHPPELDPTVAKIEDAGAKEEVERLANMGV